MSTGEFDLVVLGAGSGGVRAARTAAALGARVAIVEAARLGGTCVNLGCVPKKLFVYASQCAEAFADARSFGWEVDAPRFHWPTLLANKNTEIARLNRVYERLLDEAGVRIVRGHGRIVDAHTIAVGGDHLRAPHLLVATGGHAHVPAIPGGELAVDSDRMFFLDALPQRALVVGGGYIAVEFAGILHGLGVETTLLHRGSRLLRGFDEELCVELADTMRRRGIRLLLENTAERIARDGRALTVELGRAIDGDTRLSTDLVLGAIGRLPNSTGFGLETLGVERTANGAIRVDSHYRSSVPSILAIGDVTDRVNLTPVATAEGMAVAHQLFASGGAVDYEGIPSCVFSQPNLASVGLTEAQARACGYQAEIFAKRFRPMQHSLSDNPERTLLKLVVDRASDRVLGAHMLGPDAGEIIQGLAVALKAGATKATFDATLGIHPTVAEEFVTLRNARE